MENYPTITDNIKLSSVLDLIRVHFYIKMLEKNVAVKDLSDRELSILCELYNYGGIVSKDSMIKFSKICSDKKLTDNSLQSIRNVLGKARFLGLVKRPKANKWLISNDYLPYIESDNFIFKYTIHNISI